MHEKALREIAAAYGITAERKEKVVDSAVSGEQTDIEQCLVSLLQAANLPISEAAEAENLSQHLQEQLWEHVIEPVQVLGETQPLTLPIRLFSRDERDYQWTLTEESGAQHSGSFRQEDLEGVARVETSDRRGRTLVLHSLVLDISLPVGYHEFVVRAVDQPDEGVPAAQLLIVTPQHCYIPPGISGDNRVWGLSVHLHAVRSRSNWGIGDFSDLMKILSLSAEAGAGTVHTAPLTSCVMTADGGKNPEIEGVPNPYSPSCRSQLNILFIDVEEIADYAECDAVKEIIQQTEFQARLTMLKDQRQINYPEICTVKTQILQKLWDYFHTNHLHPETSRGLEFRQFQERGGDTLRHFGIFSALHEKFGTDENHNAGWNSWPAAFKGVNSQEAAEFAGQQEYRLEYFHYLQWQAELQQAALGRRSMELGLKVGFLGEFPFSVHKNGFESWRYRDVLLDRAVVLKQPFDNPGNDPAVGLPLFLPHNFKKNRYQPFIEGLRHNMRYAGALTINSIANYSRTYFSLAGLDDTFDCSVSFPFADLLGIICLESQRNRCLVIGDNIHLLPKNQQEMVQQRNIFDRKVFFQTRNDQGGWLGASEYPSNAVTTSSASFLATAKGFWKSRDIALQGKERLFVDDNEKEKAIIARASDRVHLLITLGREDLLPDGCSVDQTDSVEMDQPLLTAQQVFLARTPSKIHLVAVNDLLGLEEQAEPPALTSQKFWEMSYPVDLEEMFAKQENAALFKTLCRERGVGNVRPSALISDRKKRENHKPPLSFYRLQLHKGFNFRQAAAIIPYLNELGISHCYVSPFLMARSGSTHGYDIIDHSRINPEIGNREDFESFLAVLEQHGMALILDIVPNHMGIGSDNKWWMDVLENGEASKYARFFDINWLPQQTDLAGRVLLPVLGDYYGKILEEGQLKIFFYDNTGNFSVGYYDHRFPISPKSYPALLGYDLQRLEKKLGEGHHSYQEFENLIQSFENLPGHGETSAETMQILHRSKEVSQRTLARLCRKHSEIKQFIEENIIFFNGIPDKPESFDLLHALLEEQPYRLAYWLVATDEINYRRFFDINDLAALRTEDIEVFNETHRLILDLVATGRLDGLRIDHPDGLYDPYEYFCRLQAFAAGQEFDLSHHPGESEKQDVVPLYVVVEKILADFESLPRNWPVSGTTGYEFSNLLNGLFVNSAAEKTMTAIYYRFIGAKIDYEQLLYDSKKLIIRSSMAGELNVLASFLYRLAQANRRTRDLTFNSLRDGLIEVVCFFPVYRTYTSSSDKIDERDVQFIEWALAKAQSSQQLKDSNVFGFIKSILLLEIDGNDSRKQDCLNFVMKFQQYTGPVMAKGLEDTFFYRYNRLLSLNEVGGNPDCFGISVAAFHQNNQARLRHWPHTMLNTSTHDSKRSEDVRARINVLSEAAPEWKERIKLWSMQNRSHKIKIAENQAPSKNDEYGFYQNLLGAWPVIPPDEHTRSELIDRMKNTLLKTSREAKMLTSWTSPNPEYEEALMKFVEGSLGQSNSPFLNDFIAFHEDIAWFGMLNSLSQVFLKMICPGIPDIYQGNECFDFSLVDPDNRRPIDYQARQSKLRLMLEKIHADAENNELNTLQHDLLTNLPDGRAKMYIIAKILCLRNSWQEVFSKSSYLPLEVTGDNREHICAFAREKNDRMIVAVAPRLFLTLMQGKKDLPLGDTVWHNTEIRLPENKANVQLQNIFSEHIVESKIGSPSLPVGRLLQSWPVALLKSVT